MRARDTETHQKATIVVYDRLKSLHPFNQTILVIKFPWIYVSLKKKLCKKTQRKYLRIMLYLYILFQSTDEELLYAHFPYLEWEAPTCLRAHLPFQA